MRRFLKAKRLITGAKAELGAKLRELWFTLYSRGGRVLGSSGFEHVFMGEKKAGRVQGLHSWVFLHHLEQRGQVASSPPSSSSSSSSSPSSSGCALAR